MLIPPVNLPPDCFLPFKLSMNGLDFSNFSYYVHCLNSNKGAPNVLRTRVGQQVQRQGPVLMECML